MAIIGLIIGLAVFIPEKILHRTKAVSMHRRMKLFTLYTELVIILFCTLPMTLAPAWNGTVKAHRDQYERMAESLLEGKLYIDYDDIDPRLAEMENPYDPDARKEAGVRTHWDHAYFEGRYYMYFGIVPVLLLFLPFRVITGHTLNTMHATQIFTACAIIGIFALLKLLAKRFFPKMTLGTYLVLAMSVSVTSFWFAADYAALYSTAITSAVCMIVWSFFFFFKAVYGEPQEDRQIRFAALGSLFGALAFGCRPSTALANLLVVPLLVSYLKQKKAAGQLTRRLAGKLVLAALPYAVVAAGLMMYNAARFHDPFEFGQAYQLTSADQHEYGNMLSRLDLTKFLSGIESNFFALGKHKADFPWTDYGGAFWNFPLLLFGPALLLPKNLRAARKKNALGTMTVLLALPLIITVITILWAPFLTERYRMDIYYLMGIAAFCAVGFLGEGIEQEKDLRILRTVVTVLALAAMMKALLFWLVPRDSNYTQKVAGALQQAAKTLFFHNIPQ